MHASTGRRAGRAASAIGPGVAVVLLIGWLCAARGDQLHAALAGCPPWAIAGATLAHALTLLLRTEAWRTVLAAGGAESLDSRVLHTANAGSFLVGMLQSHAALPARIALLRRLGGDGAPAVSQVALADAPILLLEVCTSALLAGFAATAFPAIPAWAPLVLLFGALALMGALRATYLRFRSHRLAAGLAVLAEPARRTRLVLIVTAFTLAALLRTWIVLMGFGLPSGPADAALLLFSMGAIGLLPLGAVGTAPTATVAAMGAANLTVAAAAGMVTGASTMLAVLLYAGACGIWRVVPEEESAPDEPAEVIPLPVRHASAGEPELEVVA
jgi:hypothetical protein